MESQLRGTEGVISLLTEFTAEVKFKDGTKIIIPVKDIHQYVDKIGPCETENGGIGMSDWEGED